MIYNHTKKILIILCILLCTTASFAEPLKKVVILPFTLYSEKNDDLLGRKIAAQLATELRKSGRVTIMDPGDLSALPEGKEIDEQQALRKGEALGADTVIIGSLTRFGTHLSADVKTVDVARRKTTQGIYANARGTDDAVIGSITAQLSGDVLLRIYPLQTIARIEIEGNSRIEDSMIKNAIDSAEGGLFSEATLSSDIKAIYRIGYFSDVRAAVTESPEGRVIRFTLVEMPLISEVVVAGNDDVDKKDIEPVLSVESRQILNLEKVKSDTENIRTLYRNKGFFNAEVSYRTEKDDSKIRVIYDIVEKKKVHIKEIVFDGNEAYTDDELKDMMDTSEWGIFSFLTESGLLNEDKLKQDIGKLAAFYLNNGYINATIGEPVITNDEKWIYITIPVTEGKQFKIGEVTITGDLLSIPRSDLLEELNVRKKVFFDREAIMKDMDYLTELCNNEGYAYANVTPQTQAHEEEQQVDITYHVEKGNLVYINRINITGNTVTRDKVIRRGLAVVEGDLYNSRAIKSSYMSLNRLRYFEEINFQTDRGPSDDLMDIDIQVKEQPTGMFSIGAGYSATDKMIFMAQVSQRNLFGRGQTLGLKAYLGASTTNYELSFTEPYLFDKPLWSQFEVWNMDKEYDSYDLDSKGAKVTFGYPLFERVKGYIGYEFSIDNVNNVLDTASYYIKEQEGETTSSGVTLTLTRDTTDDAIFPSRGSKNSASVEHTGTIFQGNTSYTKYTGLSHWFFPLPLETVFSVRGRLGYVHGNEGREIPIYKRFYLGGINSLRGLRDVGPTDPDTGDVIGGETMVNFNAEFIFPLIKDAGLKGAIFYDTGNTWNSGYHLDDLRQTAGLGVRWYSPVGPLRIEWGYVLDRKEDEPQSRWEFTVGMFMR